MSTYRIAVLGYGSLPNQLENHGTTLQVDKPPSEGPIPPEINLQSNSPFIPTDLTLPLRLGRVSGEGTLQRRITMILYAGAKEEPVFYAVSRFTNLQEAIENLQKREGCPNSRHIGYVDLKKDRSKSQISEVAQKVKEWAKRKRFDAVIWTDLPAKGVEFREQSTGEEILPLLIKDPILLENTKAYISKLAQNNIPLLKKILKMPKAEVLNNPQLSQGILPYLVIAISLSIVFFWVIIKFFTGESLKKHDSVLR